MIIYTWFSYEYFMYWKFAVRTIEQYSSIVRTYTVFHRCRHHLRSSPLISVSKIWRIVSCKMTRQWLKYMIGMWSIWWPCLLGTHLLERFFIKIVGRQDCKYPRVCSLPYVPTLVLALGTNNIWERSNTNILIVLDIRLLGKDYWENRWDGKFT